MYLPGSPNRLNRKLHEFFNSDIIGDKTKPKESWFDTVLAGLSKVYIVVGSGAARHRAVLLLCPTCGGGWFWFNI